MSDEEQLTLKVMELRTQGVFFSEIGSRLGIHKARARYLLKRAVLRGETTLEAMGLRKLQPKKKLADGPYNLQWVMRILARCKPNESGCWIWQGPQAHNGYGMTSYRTERKALEERGCRAAIVHREMYRVMTGAALTKWQYVCHHCDERLCCNPAHLFLGSPTDNSRDEIAKGRHPESKVTHCPKGHEYNAENTYIAPTGARNCKPCQRAKQNANYRANREQHNARNRMYRQRRKEREAHL